MIRSVPYQSKGTVKMLPDIAYLSCTCFHVPAGSQIKQCTARLQHEDVERHPLHLRLHALPSHEDPRGVELARNDGVPQRQHGLHHLLVLALAPVALRGWTDRWRHVISE